MPASAPTEERDALVALLEHLKATRGFDFTGYKRTTLGRRVAKRMAAVGVADHEAYADYLTVEPAEYALLFDTLLINVTGFFRDAPTWEHLAEVVLPELLSDIGPTAPIRAWCAGCASGEEAYTIAMLLAEALGEDAYRARVKVYATDVDENALAHARAAVYDQRAVEAVPPALLDRWFERTAAGHVVRADLRRGVIFGRNDLVQDAPISRVDILSCRNTLIYFNTETQDRILPRLHFAINPHGVLILGRSEMLIRHAEVFRPQDLRRRIFRPVSRQAARPLMPLEAELAATPADRLAVRLDATLDALPLAHVIVDESGVVLAINRAARGLLGVGGLDVGRPLKDLELSYRPVELRAPLADAMTQQRATEADVVSYVRPGGGGEEVALAVSVTPVILEGIGAGAAITFADVTRRERLQKELAGAREEIDSAYEELQSTVEELETTNEELQSTNEELATTNEELQSTNEELETINEELQSTNEELETINGELRIRSGELNVVNAFLETVLRSVERAVIVVDGELSVLRWNSNAADLWGLRADEVVGQNLLALDIGLPLEELRGVIRDVLGGTSEREERTLTARDRRGRDLHCAVTTIPLHGDPHDEAVTGAVLFMAPAAPPAPA